MNLLFVHEKFGAFAGAETNILAVARELKQRGHALAIWHGAPTGKNEAAWREIFPIHFSFEEAENVFEMFEPDAIYVHKLSDLKILKTLLASGAPLVRMVHDHDLYCMKSYKYNVFTRRPCARALSPFCVFPCGAFLARNHKNGFPLKWVSYAAKREEIEFNQQFDRLVVATKFMRQELLRNGFDANKIEIHAPVPPPEESSPQNNFSNRNLIIYAGQITRGKGVDVLLESLALVRAPFACFVFGDGNHRARCEKLSRKLGLNDRVHFKGYVSPSELKNFYAQASVAVVSSVWPEPFGATGLEAMRRGVPVVAFDSGGIREWLLDGQNGFLVPWMNRAAFAARVEKLLRDKPLARQLGEQGRQMTDNQFDFSRYVDGLENLFSRLAKEICEPAIP